MSSLINYSLSIAMTFRYTFVLDIFISLVIYVNATLYKSDSLVPLCCSVENKILIPSMMGFLIDLVYNSIIDFKTTDFVVSLQEDQVSASHSASYNITSVLGNVCVFLQDDERFLNCSPSFIYHNYIQIVNSPQQNFSGFR